MRKSIPSCQAAPFQFKLSLLAIALIVSGCGGGESSNLATASKMAISAASFDADGDSDGSDNPAAVVDHTELATLSPIAENEAMFSKAAVVASSQPAPAIPTIVSIKSLGNLGQNSRIMLRDGGVSTRIGNYSYWLFADTQDGYTDENGEAQINYYSDNSLSATDQKTGTSGINLNRDYLDENGQLKRFIPWSDQDTAWVKAHSGKGCAAGSNCGAYLGIWPSTIAYDPSTKLVVVGFNQVKRGGDIQGYPSTGGGLAIGKVGTDGWLTLERSPQGGSPDNPTLMWSPNELNFTNAAFIKDGYYYAYAYGNWWDNFLGRVPVANLLDKTAWNYYAGNGVWSSDVNKASVLFSGGTGNDIFYNDYLKQWVTVYLGYNNNQVYMRVANSPEGKWSEAKNIATLPFQNGAPGYIAHVHPELSGYGEHIYLSYTMSPAKNRQVLPIWDITVARPNSIRIEAENYTKMSGVKIENCTEGGQDVGSIDTNDWMSWDVNVPAAGVYTVQYRVASLRGGGKIQIEKAGGGEIYGSVDIPKTGGWQKWTTVSHTVTLKAGQQSIAVKALSSGSNINWFEISQ